MKATQIKRNWLIESLTSNENAAVENFNGFDFITYQKNGLLCLAVISENAAKPMWHYSFRTIERMNESLTHYKSLLMGRIESKARYAEEKKAKKEEAANGLNVGDILYSSWGYDQTNIDFYMIVEKKGMTIKLQQVKQQTFGHWNGGGQCVPTNETFGEVITKRINAGYIKISSCQYAYKWSGTPQTFTNYA